MFTKRSRSYVSFLSVLALLLLSGCVPTERPGLKIEELTIAQTHRAYLKGEFTSERLVMAYLERIQQLDPQINAITVVNPAALDIARSLDKEFEETGTLRPLHGIPVIVKDNINTAGLPTTAGSWALENYIPTEDAFIIQRLVAAGAIVLAKSNMAEWAFSPMHSESSTGGTTRNPYNLDFVPAGSSGGTGAAIAANFGIIGLGTDTGNSIRGPSSHCALVGFRTTLGLVSRSAIVPLYLRNDVVGPMCRSVEDAARVLQVIAGYHEQDPLTQYGQEKRPESYLSYLQSDALSGARIGVLQDLTAREMDDEVRVAFDQAVTDLGGLGATVVDMRVPNFDALSDNQWCASFREDLEAFLEEYVQSDTLQTLEDVIRVGSSSEWALRRLERNAANEGRWSDSEIPCLDPYSDVLRIAFREGIERAMDSLQLDALIYPSWNFQPAAIDKFEEEYLGDNSQIISPHTGQPAFTVPMGFSSKNLPMGLQFLGRMYDEPTLIGLTYAYEQATKHRRMPAAP